MSYPERVKKLVEFEGSQAKLCEKTGLSKQTINRIVNTGSGVNGSTIEAIALAYADHLNLEWFITGKGEMWKDGQEPDPNGKIEKPEMPDEEKELLKDEIIALQKKRIRLLELEIKEKNPDLADRLGIE